MTTYPLNPPPIRPATEDWTRLVSQGIAQSPYSGASSVINNYFQWQLEIGFAPEVRGSAAAKAMMAWLLSLNGAQGSFLYYPEDTGLPITGKTLASPGFAYSSSIVATGWFGGEASGLTAGDYFSIGNSLFCITQAPVNASAGNVTLSFDPPLRTDVNAGSVVNFLTPRCEMRLVGGSEGQGHSKGTDGVAYFKTLTAVEAL